MGKRRILLVDDDTEAPRLMKRLLEMKCPYEVLLEHDPRRAVESAMAFKPDLVLMDVIMPGLHGSDVALLLHAVPELHDLPILFLSAVPEPISGFPFLSKPASIDSIISAIQTHLPPEAREG